MSAPSSTTFEMADPIDEAEALRRLRATDDPSAQYYAAWWLGRHRNQHPDTLPLLLAAMRQRRARQLGDGVEENAVARNATRAVGKLGPSASEAIPVLLELLDDPDYGLREAAARSLGELRAKVALPALVWSWSIYWSGCPRNSPAGKNNGSPWVVPSRVNRPSS